MTITTPTAGTQIIRSPFTILIDAREKAPYAFRGLDTDSDKAYSPLFIQTEVVTLRTGDYSIKGFEDQVSIERKSLADLYSTLGSHRERFEREHERLAEMEYAAVVIESDLANAIANPPERSRLHPRAVRGAWTAWSVRYRVPWIWVAEDKRLCEKVVWHLLKRFWVEKQREAAREAEKARK